MTLTLEVPETVERTFREGAKRRGVAPEKYFAELVEQAPAVVADTPATNGGQKPLSARQQAALDGYGKYAGRGRTSDDLIRERREEAAMEMAQAARRDAGDFS